jgi:cadmium resistance protein CadD (predicted permease)
VIASVLFTTTNVDDLLRLVVLHAHTRLPPARCGDWPIFWNSHSGPRERFPRCAVALTLSRYRALLGAVPLAFGLLQLGKSSSSEGRSRLSNAHSHRAYERALELGTHSKTLIVAAATVANGADNIAAYSPLFGSTPTANPLRPWCQSLGTSHGISSSTAFPSFL